MAKRHLTPVLDGSETLHSTGTLKLVPARVAEETGEYDPEPSTSQLPQALRKIEIEALRRAADTQICRLLKLANLLEDPLEISKEERALCAQDLRATATLLEEFFLALATTAENANQPATELR